MWFIIQTVIISIIIIIIFHYSWNYIKDLYSTKKTRDLVGSQTQKYKTILDEILQNKNNIQTLPTSNSEFNASELSATQLRLQETNSINEKEEQELTEDLSTFIDSYISNNQTLASYSSTSEFNASVPSATPLRLQTLLIPKS